MQYGAVQKFYRLVSLKCDRNSPELFIAKSSTNLIGTVPQTYRRLFI